MSRKKEKIYQGDGWSFNDGKAPTQSIRVLPMEKHKLKVFLEKRKKGKQVTVLGEFFLSKEDIKELARNLKGHCGTGGTVTDNTIELQGDCIRKTLAWLNEKGWSVIN